MEQVKFYNFFFLLYYYHYYDCVQEDGEAFNIMLVQGQDSLQDRLFSGGEEVGSQFTVFRRVM